LQAGSPPQSSTTCYFSFIMVFTSLLVSVLLATAALAAPSTPVESRVARRKTRPLQRLASSVMNTSHVVYSSNWAGAVWDTYPSVRYVPLSYEFKPVAYLGRAHSRPSPGPSPSRPPVPPTVLRRPGLASMATHAEMLFFRPELTHLSVPKGVTN